MKKQYVSLLAIMVAVSGFLFSCGDKMNKNTGSLEFDSIQVNETAHLFSDTAKPACNLVIDFREYRRDLEPMYLEDEKDKEDESSIGAWYSYYKGIESHVQLYEKNLLVYRIDYNEYTGGAHGIYMTTFLNMDLGLMRPLRLDDVFVGEYQEALTDLIWNQLMADNEAKTRAELEDMGYGSTGEIAPTENFYLDKDGVTFYYNVYDITPYAMGPVTVSIPFQMLEHMLGSNPVVGELKN